MRERESEGKTGGGRGGERGGKRRGRGWANMGRFGQNKNVSRLIYCSKLGTENQTLLTLLLLRRKASASSTNSNTLKKNPHTVL